MLLDLWIRVSLPLLRIIIFGKHSPSWSRIQTVKTSFWRNFNIKKATDNIRIAWAEVTQSRVNGVRRKIWLDIVTDFHGFETEEISNASHAIIDMARCVAFEEMDEASVKNCFSPI
jgi:hypothetical protein